MKKIIWINGRFLERSVTGVERVATEVLNELAHSSLDEEGSLVVGDCVYQFRLVAPRSTTATSPWPNIPLVKRGLFSGHLWEQLNLPVITAGDWLLSLCNTGPILKRRHYLFLHDAQPFAVPHNFSLAFRTWYKLLFRLAGRTAKRILVNSEFTKAELQRYVKIPGDKITRCYLGGDHVLRQAADERVLERFDLPQKPFVLAVSSMNPNKNMALLSQAIERLGAQSPDCVVVGKSGQSHFGQVAIASEKMHFLGYVSDDELLALYRRAACLVFPSFYEGFGLPLLEAMVLGCPAIASATTSMLEIGADAIEYCDPTDADSLATAIERVVYSPQKQADLRRSGYYRAREFAWAKTCQALLSSLTEDLRASSAMCGPAKRGLNHCCPIKLYKIKCLGLAVCRIKHFIHVEDMIVESDVGAASSREKTLQ